MKHYEIAIMETLRKVVSVNAESIEEAMNIVKRRYNNGIYVLCTDDIIGHEFREAYHFRIDGKNEI